MTYRVLKAAFMVLLITVVAPVGMAGEPLAEPFDEKLASGQGAAPFHDRRQGELRRPLDGA